jgi:hypothetical protein
MASKSIFQKFNDDAIEHFGISCDPYGIMTSATNATIETVYLDESDSIYDKIENILESSKATSLSSYKKAYLLPNCRVSTDRVKSALKEHGVVLTGDYMKAEIYITHDYISNRCESSENISTRYLLSEIWNYEAVEDGCNSINKYCEDNMRNGERARVIYDPKCEGWVNRYNTDFHAMPYEGWMMTGMAVNIAHKIDTGEATTMDVDTVLHSSANKIEITEELIEQLGTMLNSYDDENLEMVGKILPTIDYTKKKHLMWRLGQEIGSNIYRISRNKDVDYWKRVSKVEDYYHKSALDMIKFLEGRDQLNREAFKYLEPTVRKEIRIENRDLYVFRVEVKPEYKKYLKNEENN